jgi:PH-interacting protein
MQIWHASTAVLAAACRGHEEEVTDLAIDFRNDLLASSSNDKSIRVWSLEVPCFCVLFGD